MASRQFEPEEVHELLAKGGWGRCKVSAAKWDGHSKLLVKLGARKETAIRFR